MLRQTTVLGSTALAERPEGKRFFDMRYTDVVDTTPEFMRRGVIIKTVINGMTFDGSTTDPMQQAVRDALKRLHGSYRPSASRG
jgi:putative DNA-invertase from lambdoid prophage Rac